MLDQEKCKKLFLEGFHPNMKILFKKDVNGQIFEEYGPPPTALEIMDWLFWKSKEDVEISVVQNKEGYLAWYDDYGDASLTTIEYPTPEEALYRLWELLKETIPEI